MALRLPTQNPFDGVAEEAYWKVVESNINWASMSCHIVLAGYLDSATRQEGRQPITSRNFDWSGSDFPYTVDAMSLSNLVAITYNKIKSIKTVDSFGNETMGEFYEAEDV